MYPKFILTLLMLFLGLTGSFFVNAQRTGLNQARTLSVQSNDSLINNSISGNQKEFESSKHSSPFDAVKGKKEDQSKRDAYSKHYINEDGSFTALIGAGPIHYEKNGQFLDIDYKITANSDANYPFANTSNLFESYFGATAHTGVKNKTAEGEVREFLNTKMYWEVAEQAVSTLNSNDVAVSIEGDKAYYYNLYGAISAEFTTLTGKRKLNYIIPNKQALGSIPDGADYLVFTEDVVLPFGWTSSITETGVLIKDQLGQEIYLYENPHSTDAESHALREDNTIFETSQIGNTLTIMTKVKTEWLLSNERQFPVLVDPTISVNTINSNSTGQCWPTGGGYGNPYVGYNGGWYRSWVTFDLSSLPALSKGSVSSVSTSFYVRSKLGTAGTYTVRVGHSKFDLASTTYFPLFSGKYDGIIDPVNAAGAYGEIPMSTTLNAYATLNLSDYAYEIIETQTGTVNAFFPVSLSPSWGTGTTNRAIGFYGHDDTRKPILTITYSEADTHCHPTHTSANCAAYGDCQYIGISNVSIGSINNTTTFNNAPNGYNSYTNLTTDVSEGSTYSLNVTYRDGGGNLGQLAAWIDWNNDGDFNDANEYLGVFNNRTNNQVTTFSVNVPSGTTAGIKRLRVRSVLQGEGLSATDACTTKQFGETEDYSLNVVITSGMPNNIVFHNYGGSDQLTFNNSRIETNTPIFRMSHSTSAATDYEVQISTAPNFSGGTSWTQTFTGTYPLNTEANFTFTNGFTPTSGTTYYVRARVRGAANVWSSWTTETYSFTYDTSYSIPNWFQTTQAQFQTDELSGVVANGSHDVVTNAGSGNVITNGSFEDGLTGWTISKPYWYTVASEPYGNTEGVNSLNIYNIDPGSFGNFSGDNAGAYQNINMSGVSNISIDLGYESTTGSSLLVNIEVYISDLSQTSLRTGTKILDWRPTQNVTTGNSFTVDVSSYGFTGNKLIKIVAYLGLSSTDYAQRYFYIDNIRTTSNPQGTIISTPIHLASVQGASVYQGLEWNQTLNGGEITFKIQSSADGISGWTDVPGFNNISATGSGVQNYDLSAMSAYDHIRLVGTLNGAGVTLHDWAIIYDAVVLPVELTHFSASCEEGTTAIRWETASETNSDYFAVEKSRDGFHWTLIEEKTAAGHSTTNLAYRSTDYNSASGTTYYRLRQVDYDGKEEIFGPISSSCSEIENSVAVYPNPNKGNFMVRITSSKNYSDAILNLVDVTGKLILSKQMDIPSGTMEMSIDHLNLSNGIYFVKIQGEGVELAPVKVIVNK